jgi:hypothetical protein
MAHPFFTIGHSTRSVDDFVELLRQAKVQLVLVRRAAATWAQTALRNPARGGPVVAMPSAHHDRLFDRIWRASDQPPRDKTSVLETGQRTDNIVACRNDDPPKLPHRRLELASHSLRQQSMPI